jgi:hypothetical protein
MWSRAIVFGATIGLWLVVSIDVYLSLVESARDTLEIYARTPQFQAVNFAIGYLPLYLVLLAGVLFVEWLFFAGLKWSGVRLGVINKIEA